MTSSSNSVRTRFAPSPTGFLHIGGVRTALFNWLFAKANNGKFILRIDDTDQQRNVEEALKPILNGFKWLGIDWDEGPEAGGEFGPYYQSQRAELYQAAVQKMLSNGTAYRDYASSEEFQAEREAAQNAKTQFTYSRTWMADTDEQAAKFEAEGRTAVIRLKIPRQGALIIQDLVRGNVKFEWAREQDHVIQRADGSCLYHLATVVDDHAMQISHVIRAEEHLPNTPRQVFIFEALGYDLPKFAHLPYVAEPGSKSKLSKRKLEKYLKNRDFAALNKLGQALATQIGIETSAETFNPVLVDFYETIGFLPEALLNYLLLLGWSLDDKTEEFTISEMIEHFSLERVNKAPASFDPAKLTAFQDRAMQKISPQKRTAAVLPFLQKVGLLATPPTTAEEEKNAAIVAAAGDRIKMGGDILQFKDFYTADEEIEFQEKAFTKRLLKPDEAAGLLQKFSDVLAKISSEDFTATFLDKALHDFVTSEEIKIGQVIHALRVGVTGTGVGFGMFETLEILGKDSCLVRIRRTLEKVAQEKIAQTKATEEA